ncbi:MAG TPA: hypothetical protein VFQ43_20685, partial [Nitrososphaera sp.]|nr:hypothetical protein [Nitrososphaera sp.]
MNLTFSLPILCCFGEANWYEKLISAVGLGGSLKMTGKDKLEQYNPERTISSCFTGTLRQRLPGIAIGVLCFVLSLFFYYGTVLRVQL